METTEKKKESINIEECFCDPEMRALSLKLYKIAGTLKPEDYYERFTI